MKKIINSFLVKYLPVLTFFRKSYSQEGEDLMVDRLLGGMRDGFYVEIGAHHPFRFSNTYYFYKKGWTGICIDPLPGTKKSFNKWRSKDIALEIGISSQQSKLEYFMFNEAALNTFDAQVAKSRDGVQGYCLTESRVIETFPLSEVLPKYMPFNKAIDLLSVDVEGYDLDVLESNDWNRFKPKIIIVECLVTKLVEVKTDPIFIFLKNKGYELYGKTGFSFIFIRESK